MTLDPTVLPGLSILALELLALAAVGYVVARVALGQTHDGMAMAQGMVLGPALWGMTVNLILYVLPGQAGALAGWVVVLALGAALAWRAPNALRMPPRTVATVAIAVLALFWVALASRQLLNIPDSDVHLPLTATLRAGQFPPESAWSPDESFFYPYGMNLLIGLLTPPVGPDLAFTTELLGAYFWTSLSLVVGSALLRWGVYGALVTTPLLLTAGAWTLVWYQNAPDILRIAAPTGIPSAGIRASLTSIYWPDVDLSPTWPVDTSPPNIWKPRYILAYALSLTVLERAVAASSDAGHKRWILALLVGFLSLLAPEVALIVLAAWAVPVAVDLLRDLRSGQADRWLWLRAGTGPALAAILLAIGGGFLTGLVSEVEATRASVGWHPDAGSRHPFGTATGLPGGVGVLGIGVVSAAVVAVVLARRSRLVVLLAVASCAFLIAALTLQYVPMRDVTRLDGHARNFALLAVMIGLASRLSVVRTTWRYAAGALVILLITWPTSMSSMRMLGMAASQGVALTDSKSSSPGQFRTGRDTAMIGQDIDMYRREVLAHPEAAWALVGRQRANYVFDDQVVSYIREETAVDDRILSPHPHDLTAATGRSNSSGFQGYRHRLPRAGPDYLDAIRFLEPAAIRRLGIDYVHSPHQWEGSLPDRARQWLSDPELFEVLVNAPGEALYRVRPAFREHVSAPTPESFEALRDAIPPSATVAFLGISSVDATRLASVLADAQLLGDLGAGGIHLVHRIETEPLTARLPDVVVIPEGSVAFLDASTQGMAQVWRRPVKIWQSYGLFAFAANSSVTPPVVPAGTESTRANISVRLSDLRTHESAVSFTVRFTSSTSDGWTGQDWLVVPVDNSVWALPTKVDRDRYTLSVAAQWYTGQFVPSHREAVFAYDLDARAARLSVERASGEVEIVESSGTELAPGVWALTLRLRNEHRQAAVIPVLRIEVTDSGEVFFSGYGSELNAVVD